MKFKSRGLNLPDCWTCGFSFRYEALETFLPQFRKYTCDLAAKDNLEARFYVLLRNITLFIIHLNFHNNLFSDEIVLFFAKDINFTFSVVEPDVFLN